MYKMANDKKNEVVSGRGREDKKDETQCIVDFSGRCVDGMEGMGEVRRQVEYRNEQVDEIKMEKKNRQCPM